MLSSFFMKKHAITIRHVIENRTKLWPWKLKKSYFFLEIEDKKNEVFVPYTTTAFWFLQFLHRYENKQRMMHHENV